MAKKRTVPLKVTAHLIDGRINSAYGVIMLDGILYHAWFCKYAPHVLEGYTGREWSKKIGLPLMQLDGNRWAASRAVFKQISVKIENYNKRPNFFNADKIDKLNADKGIISDSVGLYRAYRNPNIVHTVENGTLTFFCRGHKDEVLEMLNLIPAVSKKPAMGFGVVEKWVVEDCEEDYSLWHPEYGLMRPMPVEEDDGTHDMSAYPILQWAVKPPYWKQCNVRLCYVPIV